MGMSVGGGGGVKSEPNVVPMIDIMLVLLIIFMIVIPAIGAGFTATPPTGANLDIQQEADEDQILGIDVRGNYYLNRQPVAPGDLETALRRIYEVRDPSLGAILFVKADRDIEYQKVLDALHSAAAAGVTKTGLIGEMTRGGQEGTVVRDIGGEQ
jgi:biopolymer transport protein TolR